MAEAFEIAPSTLGRTPRLREKHHLSFAVRMRFRAAMKLGALAGAALALFVISSAARHTDFGDVTAVQSLVGCSFVIAAALVLLPPALVSGLWSLVYRRYRERWE